MPNLKESTLPDFPWAIDYSHSVGQKHAKIAPLLFTSRAKAQAHNAKSFPRGRVINIYPMKEKRV